METPARILVVDDEAPIRLTLETLLRRAGYQVTTAVDGEAAIRILGRERFDVMLADLKMPGVDGMAVVRAAQERDPDVVCIILTGHGSLESAIEGLRRDIFDYLLKTSDPREVLQRVAAGVEQRVRNRKRKHTLAALVSAAAELGDPPPHPASEPAHPAPATEAPSGATGGLLRVGPFRIDPLRLEVVLDDRTVVLTPTEMRVLVCLAENAGKMLTYAELVRCAQGYDTYPVEAAELVKPHLHHLRQKLEADPAHPRYLLNVRGTGYLLKIGAAPEDGR